MVYEGDDLTEFYVHRAAMAAANLPPDVAADAFLLGLGIGLNDAAWVRNVPSFGPVLPADRIERRIRRARASCSGSRRSAAGTIWRCTSCSPPP